MVSEYQGISFPFRIGGRGGIVMSGRTGTEQQHLKEDVQVLLGTREFERVMRPYNGIEDLDVFFNDLNETTKNMSIFKINEKLLELETRIAVKDIDIVSEIQVDGSIAHIVLVSYEEVDSGIVDSLTVTF